MVKRKGAFEHTQNVRIHIILRMRSLARSFSVETF